MFVVSVTHMQSKGAAAEKVYLKGIMYISVCSATSPVHLLINFFAFPDGIAGSEVILRYRVAQLASLQKSDTYKEQINPLYESSVDSDVDEHEAV